MTVFFTQIMVKITNHAHICDQRVKIDQNQRFVLNSTLFDILTAFSTAILIGSWWRRKLLQIIKSREPNELPEFQI